MAGSAGGGFEISKAFISVEARLKKESVDAVNRQVATRLRNQPGPGDTPPSGGATPPPRTPPQPPQGGGGAAQVPAEATSTAGKERVFQEMGRKYGTALRQSFGNAIGNLGQLVVDRTNAARQAASAPRGQQVGPQGTAGAARGGATPGMTPEQIATSFTRRFAAALQRAPIPQTGRGQGSGQASGPARGGGGTVENHVYNTQVRIDPRKIDELLHAIRVVNQLKARNRARPSEAPDFESRKSGATSTQQRTVVNGSPEAAIAKLSRNATLLYKLQRGEVKLASLGLGFLERAGGRSWFQSLNINAERRQRIFREERITRYYGARDERGRPGGSRPQGSFYFNRKFRGAMYRDFRNLNASAIESTLLRRWSAYQNMQNGQPVPYQVGTLAALEIQTRWQASLASRGLTGTK